jgi:hypothetical protein
MRPTYETQEDLDIENKIASLLEKTWNCDMVKMPVRYHLDFVMKRNGKAVAFCEIKTRSRTMEAINKLGGYLLDIGKWSSAKQLVDCSGLPFILVVCTLDGTYYARFTEFVPKGVDVKGRTDRNDWQDVGPCVVLDTQLFKRIPPDNLLTEII